MTTDVKNRSSYNLEDPNFFLNPMRHEVFADLREHQPVSWRPLPGDDIGYWAVVRYDDIKTISLDPETYSSAKGTFLIGEDPTLGAMISTDPPRHTQLRRSVTDFFNNKALRPLEDWLRSECRKMIQHALDMGEVEFVFDVAANLPLSVIGKLMQLPDAERQQMFQLTEGVVAATRTKSAEQQQQAAAALAKFALGEAEIRRGKEGKDLISAMLAVDGKEQTDEEFAMMFAQIAIAATETTRTALSWIITDFAKKPDLMRQMAKPDCNMDDAVNEFLRFYPPINHTIRWATRDHELGGAQIKEGDKVVMLYPSANFDEAVFDSPQTFDITRKPNPHLTFGVGQHLCLGFRLARQELKVFLEEFLKMVDSVELLADPVMVAELQFKFTQQLNVRLTGK